MRLAEIAPGLGSGLLELGLILLLVFWALGAYNRLMRLRNALGTAWTQIDELLLRRAGALELLELAARDTLADESTSLQALRQAQDKQRLAALALRVRPSAPQLLAAWAGAELELSSPMARLHALIEQHPELAANQAVRAPRLQLAELATRIGYARQAYSAAADAYNRALTELPTRLLTRLFGFTPSGRL